MKFALISDNHDTLTGMRLAGIEGVVVHDRQSTENALNDAVGREDVGVLLITERLVKLCPDTVYDLKLNRHRPLIVEIPDRHADGRSKDSIMRYIREAIGVKI
jgi:V/A-type H+-transporting ATPase subunit F